MTTATATAEDDLPPAEEVLEEDRVSTESLLSGQEGEEAATDEEAEAAMLAGYQRANTKHSDNDVTDVVVKETTNEGGEGADTVQGGGKAAADLDDPEVPGLGMKASEVRASLGRLDALEKSTASTAGHLGHLKQLVTSAGKGKAITKEQLAGVREEFGDEFAEVFARDLTAAGFGAGASIDPEVISGLVQEQTTKAVEAVTQKLEKQAVKRVHPDAEDHFTGGKKNEAFIGFIQTLPAERQAELADTWDSEVITRALDEFKAHEKKVTSQQTTTPSRLAVTTSRDVESSRQGLAGRRGGPTSIHHLES
jgi:hypothetical protein